MAKYSKLIVALVGAAVSIAVAVGVPSDAVETWSSIVVAILTAVGVYAVPNAEA